MVDSTNFRIGDRSSSRKPPTLVLRLRSFIAQRQGVIRAFGPVFVLAAAGLAVAWCFTDPAPPPELTIAAGRRDGAYFQYCMEYAEFFAANGVTLHVQETEGSVENYNLLLNDNEIDIAIVQGGTAPNDLRVAALESVASLYLEPLWIFCRNDQSVTDIRDLKNRRVAVGPHGSGTRRMADEILAANGLSDSRTALQVDQRTGREAAEALLEGELDAAVFVTTSGSETIRKLAAADGIHLLSMTRQQAYAQLYPWLQPITLSRGVLDLAADLPKSDIAMVAPAASLVVTPELHRAFVPLFLKAAEHVHGHGSLFVAPGEFPNGRLVEHPLNASAAEFMKHGPSFLDRCLPFWIASLISRTRILLVPLITLLIPLLKITPPVYRWRIRSRIYRWYEVLREIDQDLATGNAARSLLAHQARLQRLDEELQEIAVPLSYMEEFYNLRLHVDLVSRRLDGYRPARAA